MTNADFYANLNDTQYKKYINQLIYNILLPIAFDHGFDYSVPDGIRVEPGDYVWVSFGRRRVCGVVWGPAEGGVAQEKIKAIESVAAHVPPMPETMRGFIDWVARYTLSSRGNVLRMALHDDALESPKQEVRYMIAQPVPEILRMTPARQRVVAYLSDFTARTRKEITTHAKVTDAVFRDAVAQGLLIAQMEMPLQLPRLEKDDTKPHKHTDASLSAEQQHAFETIDSHSGFHVTLLDGVTGSGKTEVYFALIEKQLRRGKQVLVLLPEIGLSVQWLTRYEARFGASPHLWHSEVSPAKKRETWRAVATGDAKVVVGARSALFLPFKHLALIIVDEEHDHSYKQEDGVYYQSRDMAVLRAQKEQVPIVLVSATPSLETVVNVEQKKYDVVHLRARYAEAELPTIEMIDMRQERLPSGTFLSAHLKAQMVKALDAGGQVMLFLNRRGYAPLVLCKSCGHRFQCPNCATWLVMHKKKVVSSQLLVASHSTNNQQLTTNNLTCHHCGHTSHIPETCPSCAAKESFMAYGPGVDRIAEEVKTFIPNARIGTMTSDSYTDGGTGSGSEATRGGETAEPERGKRSPHDGTNMSEATPVESETRQTQMGLASGKTAATAEPSSRRLAEPARGKRSPQDVIRGMESGAYDVLVGTQMVAKGHHFGNLTLVGVVDADMGLSGGDLRAGERTYQLLHQLSGRAGREKKRGHVLMQSYMPEHPVMQALVRGERDRFMQLEMQMRSDANMPPFGRLAAVIIEGNDEQSVLSIARELARTAPNSYAGLGHRERSDPRGSDGGAVQSKTSRASPGEAFSLLTILGPTPAPLFKLRGKTRYRFLIKADRQAPLQKILSNWIFNVKTPSTVRIKIDIDPYSFL